MGDRHSPSGTKVFKGLETAMTSLCPQSPREPHGCDRVSRKGQGERRQKKVGLQLRTMDLLLGRLKSQSDDPV